LVSFYLVPNPEDPIGSYNFNRFVGNLNPGQKIFSGASRSCRFVGARPSGAFRPPQREWADEVAIQREVLKERQW